MNRLYSILIVIVALFVFASLADAKPPFWDDQINNPGRFQKLKEFSDAAVLDKETGLVWEQSPDTTQRTWVDALSHCTQKTVGGRKGWRLPTIEELASLVDPNNPTGDPDLPLGHPFNVQSNVYRSATTFAGDSSIAWSMRFDNGSVSSGFLKTDTLFVLCVRGGQGIDGAGQGTGGTT